MSHKMEQRYSEWILEKVEEARAAHGDEYAEEMLTEARRNFLRNHVISVITTIHIQRSIAELQERLDKLRSQRPTDHADLVALGAPMPEKDVDRLAREFFESKWARRLDVRSVHRDIDDSFSSFIEEKVANDKAYREAVKEAEEE